VLTWAASIASLVPLGGRPFSPGTPNLARTRAAACFPTPFLFRLADQGRARQQEITVMRSYRIEHYTIDQFEQKLIEVAGEGWELLSLIPHPTHAPLVVAFFKCLDRAEVEQQGSSVVYPA
jgi:hypothetical protein